MKITEKYLRQDPAVRSGKKRKETKGITVHYTGNPMSTALGNWNYFNQGHYVNSTFLIGLEGEIIQALPLEEIPWTNGHSSNNWCITMECCHEDATGKFNEKTYKSMVELCSFLCKKYNLNPLTDLYRHSDFIATDCPKWFTENPKEWEKFKADVEDAMNPTPVVGDPANVLDSVKQNGGTVGIGEKMICVKPTYLFTTSAYDERYKIADIKAGEQLIIKNYSKRPNYVWAVDSKGNTGYIYTPFFK